MVEELLAHLPNSAWNRIGENHSDRPVDGDQFVNREFVEWTTSWLVALEETPPQLPEELKVESRERTWAETRVGEHLRIRAKTLGHQLGERVGRKVRELNADITLRTHFRNELGRLEKG